MRVYQGVGLGLQVSEGWAGVFKVVQPHSNCLEAYVPSIAGLCLNVPKTSAGFPPSEWSKRETKEEASMPLTTTSQKSYTAAFAIFSLLEMNH